MTYGTVTQEWMEATQPLYDSAIQTALDEAYAALEADGKKKLTDKARTMVVGDATAAVRNLIWKKEYIGEARNPSWDDPEWGYPATRKESAAKLSTSGVSKAEETKLIEFLKEQTWSDFAQSLARQHSEARSLSEKQWASAKKMQATMAAKAQAKAVKTAAVTSDIDLSGLPSGYYAVPGGDTRLKVRVARPTKASKWHGWTFVSDGGAYGARKNYGRQAQNGKYQGEIQDQLRAILTDPLGAMSAYGKLHGSCGACGRALEDVDSLERGIGPICAAKFAA